MISKNDICSGIVLYNPDIDTLKENISSIIFQVDCVYLFDNFSNNINEIKDLLNKFDKVSLIESNENKGIAYALNALCRTAISNGYKWIMTLDQDSVCDDGMITKMIPYAKNDVGIVCPAIIYSDSKKRLVTKNDYDLVKACMTSASLTNLEAYEKVKGFNDYYFIDYVDNEYCMKLNLNNYKILRVNACFLHHSLGSSRTIRLLGIHINLRYHSPWRTYYMARNNYIFNHVYKKHLNSFKEFVKLHYVLFNEWLGSPNKKDTRRNVKNGIKDGKNYCRTLLH